MELDCYSGPLVHRRLRDEFFSSKVRKVENQIKSEEKVGGIPVP